MKEILLTSSALILALLALRRLFRKVLSRRAQYALWGLVLLRLLVPASLPAADFSLLTAAEPVVSGLEGQALYLSPSRVTLTAPEGPLPSYRSEEDPKIVLGPPSENSVYSYTNSQQVVHEVEYARQIVLADQLPPIWHGGMAAMACWLVLSNLLFWRKLRRARRPTWPSRKPLTRTRSRIMMFLILDQRMAGLLVWVLLLLGDPAGG